MKTQLFLAALLSLAGAAGAHLHIFETTLSGANESTPNLSLGTGSGLVMLDLDLITMQVQIEFAGVTGFTSAAFIHAPTALPGTGTAGVMTPAFTDSGFPVGVTGGTYDHTFDLQVASGYDPGFILATGGSGPFAISVALQTLLESFENGTTYLEIRSAAYPNGEIRGFFTEVPEPASAAMIALGAGALALRRRRR